MPTKHDRTLHPQLALAVSLVVVLGGLGVGFWASEAGSGEHDDPSTAPVPELEFPSETEKVLAAEVTFDDGTVTASAAEVNRGGTPARAAVPPMLVVELRDDAGAVFDSFHEWDPRRLRVYEEPDDHFEEVTDEGELTLLAPFEPELAEVVVTDGDTGDELVSIDATGPAREFCRDNPDDDDCRTDLALDVDDDPDPAVAGRQLTYTATVENEGPNPAHDVVVTAELDDGVSFDDGSPSCTESAGVVTCELGRLAAGEVEQTEIVVDVAASLVYDAGGPTTIPASLAVVDEAGGDPDTDDNTVEVETLVEAEGDLEAIDLSASAPDEQVIGDRDQLELEGEFVNRGPSSPMDVQVDWTVDADAGVTVDPVAAVSEVDALTDDERTVRHRVAVACEDPGVHEIEVSAVIAPTDSDDRDPDLENNDVSTSVEIDCLVPITINVQPGQEPDALNTSNRRGNIPVALLTTEAGEYGTPVAFDATTVDVDSARAGGRETVDDGDGATAAHEGGHQEDSLEPDNETTDGDTDLLIHFEPSTDTELERGVTQLCVRGAYEDPADGGTYRFLGCSEVRVVR